MIILHIEHAITDFATWKAAFDRFADARTASGVRHETIHQPVDDDRLIVIDLGFDSVAEADQFRLFLETAVWTSPESSPALLGTPRTTILQAAG